MPRANPLLPGHLWTPGWTARPSVQRGLQAPAQRLPRLLRLVICMKRWSGFSFSEAAAFRQALS